MAPELIGRMIDAACASIDANAELLTRLDSAIGDGDHGHNLRRGFREIAARRGELVALPLGAALQKAGMAPGDEGGWRRPAPCTAACSWRWARRQGRFPWTRLCRRSA